MARKPVEQPTSLKSCTIYVRFPQERVILRPRQPKVAFSAASFVSGAGFSRKIAIGKVAVPGVGVVVELWALVSSDEKIK